MKGGTKKKKSLSAGTIRNLKAYLSAILSEAVDDEIIGFKFPDKYADCDESGYGADNFWKHKNFAINNRKIFIWLANNTADQWNYTMQDQRIKNLWMNKNIAITINYCAI